MTVEIIEPCIVTTTKLPHDVYAGRKFRKFKGGYWGNPFKGEGSIDLFEVLFGFRVRFDEEFCLRALALRGLRLACFCAPEPCHSDVIAEWVNRQDIDECRDAMAELAARGIDRRSSEGMGSRAWWQANKAIVEKDVEEREREG